MIFFFLEKENLLGILCYFDKEDKNIYLQAHVDFLFFSGKYVINYAEESMSSAASIKYTNIHVSPCLSISFFLKRALFQFTTELENLPVICS